MEAQSCFLWRSMEGGYISWVKIRGRGGDGLEVSHLFFSWWSSCFLWGLSRSNGSFMLVAHVVWSLFGLKVNLEKSKLIPLGSVDQVEELILVPGFKVGTLPFTYLGCLWELLLDLWQYVMGWKRSFVKDFRCGNDSSSLKGWGLHLLRALYLAFSYIFVFIPYFE